MEQESVKLKQIVACGGAVACGPVRKEEALASKRSQWWEVLPGEIGMLNTVFACGGDLACGPVGAAVALAVGRRQVRPCLEARRAWRPPRGPQWEARLREVGRGELRRGLAPPLKKV